MTIPYFKQRFRNEAIFAGLPAPIVLCVTDGSGRMANLIEATTEAGAAPGRYWFTTRDRLANVWGSIWGGPGAQVGLSLLSTLG